MDLTEKGYKVVSASAAAIENIAEPMNKHHHRMMMEGSSQIHEGIDDFFDTLDSSTKGKIGWLFRGLKKINKGVQKIVKGSIESSYADSANSLAIIERGLSKKQTEFERYFEENGKEVHHNWAFSQDNRELIRQVADYVKQNTKELKDVEYHKLIQYMIAFAKVQKAARFRTWSIEKIPNTPQLTEGIVYLNRYCKFAVAIYGKLLVSFLIEKKWVKMFKSESDERILLNYCEIPQDYIIHSHIKSRRYFPGYAIIRHDELKSIILCIRGTMSVFDCITDIKGDYLQYNYLEVDDQGSTCNVITGQVHAGIFECALNIADETRHLVLKALDDNPEYELIICGHSLGAGTTSLLALIWKQDKEIMRRGFKALAYAPPPVVSPELNELLKDVLFSCVYGHDVVSRLSFGSLRDICEMVKFWSEFDGGEFSLKASNIASNAIYGGNISEDILVEIYKDLKTRLNNQKLEAPGNVLQIFFCEKHKDFNLLDTGDKYVHSYVYPQYYQEIIFSRTCFKDHFPNLYEDALKFISKNLT